MNGKKAKLFRRLSRVVNTTPRALERAGEGVSSRDKAEAYRRMRTAARELEQRQQGDAHAALFDALSKGET